MRQLRVPFVAAWCIAAALCVAANAHAQVAAPAVPATSANGNYTVSWANDWGLMEQYNGGAWSVVQAPFVSSSKTFTGKPGGTYRYRTYIIIPYPVNTPVFSAEAQIVVAASAPGVPANFTVPANSASGSYTVSWSAVAGAARYTLQRRINSGSWSTLQDNSATSRAESGLGDASYGYRVRACNAVGCSGYSAVKTAVVSNPQSPPAVPGSSTSGNYTVSWNTTWGLQEQVNGGAWTVVQGPGSSSKTFTNKPTGSYRYRTYLFIGYPINATLYSGAAQIVVTLPPPASPPATFTVPATASSGSYTVSWSAVSAATRYTLQEKTGSGAWQTVQDTTALSRAFSGKTDNTYSYRVRSCNTTGCSSFSTTKAVFVLRVPAAPGAISAPATDTDGAFSLSWGASSGTAATYQLQEQRNGGAWSTLQNTAATAATLSGKPDGSYGYRVRGCNASGCSGWTAVKTVQVARVPGAPANIAGAPAENADGNYTVSWAPAGGTVSYYELQEAVGTAGWSTVYSGAARSRGFSGKIMGNYRYRVRACNQVGSFSACSNYVQSNLVTVALLILSAPATSTGSYTVSWSGNGPAGSQLWLQESVNGGSWLTVYTGTNSSVAFSQKPSGDYSYRVVQNVCNIIVTGCLQWPLGNSATVSVVPAAPGSLSGPATDNDGSYTLSWSASPSVVDRYILRERPAGGNWWTRYTGSSLSAAVSGQGDGTYDYQVQACSGTYCSAWSAQRTTVVALSPSPPSSLSLAPAVSSNGSLNLSWPAAGGQVTRYRLQQQINAGSWADVAGYGGTLLSHGVDGLGNGNYTYRVQACNTVDTYTACSAFRTSGSATVQLVAGVADAPAPLLAAAPAISSAAVRASDRIGTSAGQLRVDESGAATYRMPLAMPAGTAGVTPPLSLNYSSQAGNGLLGQGWSLGGVSAITRCRQTLAQDGRAKPISWSSDDRFCLDGQRLVLISGSHYGAVGATYHTEIDRFVTVTASGGSAGHPDFFTVTRKDGSTSHYGQTTDARQQAGPHTLSWLQNRFADSVGNAIDYSYLAGGGQRLSAVSYAGGAVSVSFDYSDNRADTISGYVAGYGYTTSRRLQRIDISDSGQLLRSYHLTYADVGSRANKTSQLTAVRECRDSVCLPATQFSWTAEHSGIDSVASGNTTFSSKSDRGLYDYRPADINGDGYMDLVWLEWDVDGSDTDHHLHYKLSDGTALQNATFTNGSGAVTYHEDVGSEDVKVQIIDYNADGRQDVIVFNQRSGRWRVLLASPQGDGSWKLSSSPIDTPVTDVDANFLDINADGLVDVVTLRNKVLYSRLLQIDTSQPANSHRRYTFGAEVVLGDVPTAAGLPQYINSALSGGLDFNGDGLGDLYLQSREVLDLGGLGGTTVVLNLSSGLTLKADNTFETYFNLNDAVGEGFNPEVRYDLIGADFNGDGLTDIVYRRIVNNASGWYYSINTGAGFTGEGTLDLVGKPPQVIDYNHDGYPDLAWRDTRDNTLRVAVWNGAGFNAAETLRHVGSANHAHLLFDINGDGRVDYVRVEDNRLLTYTGLGAHQARNKITAITNGLGNRTEISYGSLSHSGHYSRIDVSTAQSCNTITLPPGLGFGPGGTHTYCTTDSGEFYSALNGDWLLPAGSQTLGKTQPVLELTGPIYVVTELASSAPAAGSQPGMINASAQSRIRYDYGEAKLQAAGRGMLGFQSVQSTDLQTGVSTVTTYRQDFPFIGHPLITEVRTAQGHLLSRATNTWTLSHWNNGSPPLPYQPVLAESREETYDLAGNGDTQGSLLQTVITTQTYDDYDGDGVVDSNQRYGNATEIVVTTEDGSGITVVEKVTGNTYGASEWEKRMGRLSRTAVTTYRDGASATRTSAFSYHDNGSLRGLLHTETVEPGTAHALTTTYGYDAWGNITEVVQSAGGVASRTATTTFDTAGRYVDLQRNAYSQVTEQVLARGVFGQPTQLADINGVITHLSYGQLGREYFSASPTGAYVQTLLSACDGSCPASAVYKATETRAGGGESTSYFDVLARPVRSATRHFDGSWTYVDTEYDSLGRVKRTSEPHGGSAQYWTELQYDILGRVVRTDLPGISQPVTVDYNGLATITTNPAGQSKTEIANVLGEMVEVIDHLNGRLTYQYDVHGNLVRVDTLGNGDAPVSHIEMCYDNRGRKTALRDPDKGGYVNGSGACPTNSAQPQPGWWLYQYNAFGELTRQIDAKGQISTLSYDLLGRLVARTDQRSNGSTEGDTVWHYNNAPAGSGRGALDYVQDSISGYLKQHYYDTFGRLDETTTNLGGSGDDNHYQRVTYDQYGRTFQVFDAGGDGSFRDNAIQHRYNAYGYLENVVDAVKLPDGSHRTTYHTVQSMDRRGNVSEYLNGNGVSSRRSYDPATGRLTGIYSELSPGLGDIQDHTYSWDDIGNLLSRNDYSGAKSLTETFSYDGLNRLTRAQVGGQAARTVQYNSRGNIIFKTGVGSYTYGTNAGPHAVMATGDGVSYSYDANGNMTSDTSAGDLGGRTLVYTTFDKPREISKGGHTITFQYAPDRARFLRTDSSSAGTTITRYIGNVEKVAHPDGSKEIKRYLPGDVLITVYRDSGDQLLSEKTQYLHKDHLGSLDVITDVTGGIARDGNNLPLLFSFDAWGQRRNALDWATYTPAQLLNFTPVIVDPLPTPRGFTMHEHLDAVGLIHMNGRVYDPRLGRFIQADIVIQSPGDAQSYNRYTYVFNNPLAYTDPSGNIGFFAAALIGAVVGVVGNELDIPFLSAIGGLVVCTSSGGTLCAVGFAFGSTLGGGGNLGDAIRNGLLAGISAEAFSAIGGSDLGFFDKVIAHGLTGGVLEVLRGGKFGHGFLAAGLTKALNINQLIPGVGSELDVARIATAAVVGGTISEITGGKFANGAITAGFGQAYNGNSFWDDVGNALEVAGDLIGSAVVPETAIKCLSGGCTYSEYALAVVEVGSYLAGGGIAVRIGVKAANRLVKHYKAFKAAKGAGRAVNNANKVKLNKQLASQEQVGELNSGVAERIAGAGTNKKLRDAPRLANEYGGNANDWAKIRSSNRTHTDGFNQETHAYQNTVTGQIVEHKTKISGH